MQDGPQWPYCRSMPEEWIGEVLFSEAVEWKLRERRGLTPASVREAVCWGAAQAAVWDNDPESEVAVCWSSELLGMACVSRRCCCRSTEKTERGRARLQ